METSVLYALTDDGVNLPIIDVTSPAFAVTATGQELKAMTDQYILESSQPQEIPASLREALQQSHLGRGLVAASGTFLGGMSTYLLKLGPDNLAADAHPIDRRIAGSFPAFTTRIRLQDMAQLLADGLALIAAREPRRPACLLNIGGGAASDSWNALICLRAEHLKLLAHRKIVIAVLDLDDQAPAFGGRVIKNLRIPDAPLSGLDIDFRRFHYDWCDVDRLREILRDLRAKDMPLAISSEGGLFEYGSDKEIVENLRILDDGTGADAFIVGSVTRDGEPTRASQSSTRVSTQPRTIEAFRALCEPAGWIVERVIDRPFSYNVRLTKSWSSPVAAQ